MKTRILLPILFLASMLLFSCKKENNAPGNGNGSSQSNTGTLYFQNTKVDPYTIYLDGVNQGILQPSTTSGGYTVTTGITHDVKAVQYSGFWFTPYEFTGTATLNPGGTVTWSF